MGFDSLIRGHGVFHVRAREVGSGLGKAPMSRRVAVFSSAVGSR